MAPYCLQKCSVAPHSEQGCLNLKDVVDKMSSLNVLSACRIPGADDTALRG